jgi:hypothetical protein
VNLTDEYKKGVLQCRSCKKVFLYKDLARIQTEHLGLEIEEATCPHCKSRTYGVIDYPVSEEELIYKNGRFHANYNRELKIHMDQVTEEILEKDRKRLAAISKAEKRNRHYIEKYRLGA